MNDESRKHQRIHLQSRVFIELTSADVIAGLPAEIASCRILDVSRDGLRVNVDREVPVGAILQIGAELPGADDAFHLAAEVMWCRESGDPEGGWSAGFKLLNAHDSDIEDWRRLLEHV